MMRILIVEDDRELAAALDDALRYEGYATSLATTGVEALKILAGTNVDIMLLDRDLPVLSGDAVMATVAANRIPVAVIMLTAAAEVSDRVSGLDLGADDYLTKPFAYPELLARIRALQRRSGDQQRDRSRAHARRHHPRFHTPARVPRPRAHARQTHTQGVRHIAGAHACGRRIRDRARTLRCGLG
mgnify:FL=1